MKCPQCQTDNNDAAQFCGNCGARLVKVCPRCNTNNPPQYAFCGECGYDLRSTVITTPGAPVSTIESTEPAPTVTGEPAPDVSEPASTVTSEHMPEALRATPLLTRQIKVHRKIPTGIKELDEFIGGGFIANKVYLVSGESGTGKTVFGLQYLYYGLIIGESGIYASTEEKPSHLITDAESLGWDLNKYVHERKLGLLDLAPYFAELRSGKAKPADFRTILADISKHAKSLEARRIVIDPIAPIVSGQECSLAMQEYIRNLILGIEDNLNCTVLITSSIPSGTSALSRYGIEEFFAKGVIVLDFTMQDHQRVRTLSIRKMPITLTDLSDHLFDILPERGIVIREQ